jgi:hypothetical protein
MTNDMMNLQALMEKSADADLLREMIGYGAERLMSWRWAHPRAAQGELLPLLPGATPAGGEGPDGGNPGGQHPGNLHPFGGRSRPGHGDERHLQEPGLAAL